jgi:type III secretion protein C
MTIALKASIRTWIGVIAICTAFSAAHADEVQWRQQSFDLQANNEPLNTFLSKVLTLEGVSASISPSVSTGRVNGRFRGRAQTVFKELADTYGLTWYFDGATLHVYSISEIETRLLQVEAPDVPRVDRTLRQMRLFDSRFPLRVATSEGQIVVSGPPRYVELVSEVIARVADSPTQSKVGTEVRVFRLRHANALETVVNIGGIETRIQGLAQTLQELLDEGPASASIKRSIANNVSGLRGKGLIASQSQNTAQPVASAASSATTAAGQPVGGTAMSGMAVPAGARAQGSSSRRQLSVQADGRLNAIVVRDTRERMPLYAELIEALDVETPLMEIEASVIDVSDDKSEQLGLDWRLHGNRADVISSPNGLAGGNIANAPRNIANDLLFSEGPLSQGSGLVGTLIFGNARNYFLSRINALAESGDANLVSRPRVLTLDHTEAVLQSTNEFFVRVAGKDQVDLFNVSLGLTLRVTPHLVQDSAGRRNTGAQVDQIPVVSRNAIATQATVGEGQSLLVGGYVIEQKTTSKSGVPFLSDLPFVGALFGRKGSGTRRVERMFLITPRLVNLASASNAPAAAPQTAPALDGTP